MNTPCDTDVSALMFVAAAAAAAVAEPVERKEGEDVMAPVEVVEQLKKKRGRPRKIPLALADEVSEFRREEVIRSHLIDA